MRTSQKCWNYPLPVYARENEKDQTTEELKLLNMEYEAKLDCPGKIKTARSLNIKTRSMIERFSFFSLVTQ